MKEPTRVTINHKSPMAIEAAALARELLAAKSTSVGAVLSLPVTEAVQRVVNGINKDNVADRADFLACLLASLCHLGASIGVAADAKLDQEPGTSMAAALRVAAETGVTF